MPRAAFVSFAAFLSLTAQASAQTWSQRGFVDGSGVFFPQEALNDPTQTMGDVLGREELFVRPAPWIRFAGGIDVRANSHDQVDESWRVDFADRGTLRPAIAVRRLSATVTHKGFTLDAGKQFIRWGKTDILTPTDRFAPRDFLNVVSADFLPVLGARATQSVKNDTFEGVWVGRLTPSRVPLIDQRWTVAPVQLVVPLIDKGAIFPDGSQWGFRWSHAGAIEFSGSLFDGYNNLPNIETKTVPFPAAIELTRTYPRIRAYGGDAAVPTRWFTVKAEAEYFGSVDHTADDYFLYVVQLERQTGEWTFVGGYAGQAVTTQRTTLEFAPDRGLARSFVGRAAYTIDPRRSIAFEGTVRQNGAGAYAKAEFSQAQGQHWRATVSGVVIGGDLDDFLGQYRRNSHVAASLRYSF